MRYSFHVLVVASMLAGCGAAPISSDDPAGSESTASESTATTQEALSGVWTYEGSFQVDDCGRNNVPNGMNGGGFNCADPVQYQSNRQLDPESRCGGNDYFCAKPGYPKLGPVGVAGFFQQPDLRSRDFVANSVTGTTKCPTGYRQVQIGRVLTPEDQIGANQFVCVSGWGSDHYFGGTYQVDDCGQSTRNNPLTGAPTCPGGYTPQKYGRVKGAEGSQCGINQFWCDGGKSGL
jgi:hypothetical protein